MNKTVLVFLCFASSFVFAQGEAKIELANPALDAFANVRDFCISDDGNEAYFTVQSPSQLISQIAFTKKVNGKWSSPELMPFSDKYSDLEPFLSPDQTKLYFASNRALDNVSEAKKDHDIWYVARKDKSSKWSQPINMGSPVNSDGSEFYPSVSANGNLYFTAEFPSGMGKDDIYRCTFENGKYLPPQILGATINSDGYEFNAFVSRNENLLIYTKYNSKGGMGSGDLYVSTTDADGNWVPAKNAGTPINTQYMEYCPFYDEANGILYFTSRRDELKPRKFTNMKDLSAYISGSSNGLSKIYKASFKPVP